MQNTDTNVVSMPIISIDAIRINKRITNRAEAYFFSNSLQRRKQGIVKSRHIRLNENGSVSIRGSLPRIAYNDKTRIVDHRNIEDCLKALLSPFGEQDLTNYSVTQIEICLMIPIQHPKEKYIQAFTDETFNNTLKFIHKYWKKSNRNGFLFKNGSKNIKVYSPDYVENMLKFELIIDRAGLRSLKKKFSKSNIYGLDALSLKDPKIYEIFATELYNAYHDIVKKSSYSSDQNIERLGYYDELGGYKKVINFKKIENRIGHIKKNQMYNIIKKIKRDYKSEHFWFPNIYVKEMDYYFKYALQYAISKLK